MKSEYTIFEYSLTINNPNNDEITEFNINGYDGENILHEFKINDKTMYNFYKSHTLVKIKLIIIEIINKCPLWRVRYDQDVDINNVNVKINIKKKLIHEYLNKSVGLYDYIIQKYVALSVPNNYRNELSITDMKSTSYIPNIIPVEPPANFKLTLHEYQKKSLAKMLLIEREKYNFNLDFYFPIMIDDVEIIFDPIKCCIGNNFSQLKVSSNGGVLSDEMGLGKTITTISLIASNPKVMVEGIYTKTVRGTTKIISKASLVLCPSHLLTQWTGEINRCCPHLKTLVIATKTSYEGLTFNDFINYDIIITSYQFIMNFNFYPSLHYNRCTATSFNFTHKLSLVKSVLHNIITTKTSDEIKNHSLPIFEFFNFHRLILDETHEIFGNMLPNRAQSDYMSTWVSSIDADNYWYVSGTPFVNQSGLINCAKYIGLKLETQDNNNIVNFSTNQYVSSNLYNKCINSNYIWENIFKHLCIRHRKVDVESQIDILGYQERLIWVKFTDIEKQLYQAKKPTLSPTELQQLCCHPLIVQSAKKIFGGLEEIDLDVMKDKMINYHKNQLETYTNRLKSLDKTKPEYSMLSSKYNTMVSESKFILVIFEKLSQPNAIEEECCSICMDYIDKPTLTACGHMFCYDCIKMCLTSKKTCPYCKSDLSGKEIMVMDKNKQLDSSPPVTDEVYNALIEKYGSKLGKLISVIRCLVARDETRIILFSQWDDMLSLIGKSLAENGIDNSFVKGNVWSRNAAINKFKTGKTKTGTDNKVIMLSLKNAASGTNLTEATHIFFVEPVNVPRAESQAIESQAIARACRIGQKQQVLIMRIIIENCVEEEIYRKYYDANPIINFEEKDYFLCPPQEKSTSVVEEKVVKKRVVKKANPDGEPVKKIVKKAVVKPMMMIETDDSDDEIIV